jgi:hypothetical protein
MVQGLREAFPCQKPRPIDYAVWFPLLHHSQLGFRSAAIGCRIVRRCRNLVKIAAHALGKPSCSNHIQHESFDAGVTYLRQWTIVAWAFAVWAFTFSFNIDLNMEVSMIAHVNLHGVAAVLWSLGRRATTHAAIAVR